MGKFLRGCCMVEWLSFYRNNLISDNQSGFRPGDLCINQLLSIVHEIHQSFDDNLEVKAIF